MEQHAATTTRQPLFSLGFVVATPGAREAITANNALFATYLTKHQSGEWGDLSLEDVRANEQALKHGLRLLSAYHLPDGTKIWIWTEADRSSTCVMLPEEY
jgi:hypothetical protein